MSTIVLWSTRYTVSIILFTLSKQIGESYRFDLFHTERNPCSSELFLEIQGVDFLPIDAENPPFDYVITIDEDLHLSAVIESIWVADVFSTGPNFQVTITSGMYM